MFQTFFYFCSTKNQSTWQFFYFHENISRYFFSLGRGNFIKNRLRIEIDSPQYVIQTMPKITQLEVKWEWVGWAANAYFFQILTGENKNIFFGRFTLQFVAKLIKCFLNSPKPGPCFYLKRFLWQKKVFKLSKTFMFCT